MLWALAQPFALAGLFVAFLLALGIRHGVQLLSSRSLRNRYRREPWLAPRQDIDPYGAVAVLIGGVGWGSVARDELRDRPFRLLLGPVAVIATSQAVFWLYVLAGLTKIPLELLIPSDVLLGMTGDSAPQFVLSLAVGLLAFGVMALVPLPPLDGWAVVVHLVKRPGPGFQKVRLWLEERNIGVLILLAAAVLPLFRGQPLLLVVLDQLLTPVLRAWV